MDEYNGIRERAGMESLVTFLADGDEVSINYREKDRYQKEVDDAFEKFLNRLDREFHISSRDNREVCGAVNDFLMVCRDAYFKAGLAAGFHICKNLDMEYLNVKEDGIIRSMIENMAGNIL